jgi:hypothetical protein
MNINLSNLFIDLLRPLGVSAPVDSVLNPQLPTGPQSQVREPCNDHRNRGS